MSQGTWYDGDDLEAGDVRILVAGGDPGDLAVLGSVAAANDFRLDVLDTVGELVDAVRIRQPDALILDVKQRGASGYELCARIKADPGSAGVPVILISTLDGPEARRQAYAAGCDDYLEKPFNRTQLGYRLRSFARLRRIWSRTGSTEQMLSALAGVARARGSAGDRLLALCRGFADHLGLDAGDRWALDHAAALRELRAPAVSFDLALAFLASVPGAERLHAIVRHIADPDGPGEVSRLARIFAMLDGYDLHTRIVSSERALALLAQDDRHERALLTALSTWVTETGG